MIRFTWRSQAVALPRGTARWLSRSAPSSSSTEQLYPLLKRRRRPPFGTKQGGDFFDRQNAFETAFASRKVQGGGLDETAALELLETPEPSRSRNDSHSTLIVSGLSPNLNAADFYRILPNDLSSWRSVILNVQQLRTPSTLEPLGRYALTFETHAATLAYQSKLRAAHRLALLEASSRTGLWESDAQLPAEDARATVAGFTLAPGSQDAVDAVATRLRGPSLPWTHVLKEVAAASEFGEKPPVVMLHVNPPTLTGSDLHSAICADWDKRGVRWQVGQPYSLDSLAGDSKKRKNGSRMKEAMANGQDETEDIDQDGTKDGQAGQGPPKAQDLNRWEKRRSRFLVACKDEAEARRFQRHWNQRTLTGRGRVANERNVVDASIINW